MKKSEKVLWWVLGIGAAISAIYIILTLEGH